MKTNKAFTLIEILVSISILTIVTFSGSYYFFDFLENKEISNQIIKIQDRIDELDNQVKNHEIFDYKISFNSGSNLNYTIYKNIFDTDFYQTLNGTKIELNSNLGYEWNKKIYEGEKLKLNETSTGYFINYSFKDTKDYRIIGNLKSSKIDILNEIELIHFDKINKELKLFKISETKDGPEIENIDIINIGGVKSFSGTNNDSFFLHFENKGKEGYIEINKFN